MNIIKKISNWLFNKKDALNKECEQVYISLENRYNSGEEITPNHLTMDEYLNSLSIEKKEILVSNKEEIKKDIETLKSAQEYVKKSKQVEVNSEKAKEIKQNKKRKYTKKK